MENNLKIIKTTHQNILDFGSCGYKNLETPGFREKISWIKEREKEGLKILTLWSAEDGNQGMIEYIPGEYCWRPVSAAGYMFIHCVFVGLRKKYKGKGYASALLKICIEEARSKNMKGVTAVTRKGSFMIGNAFFEKNGFHVVDNAPPDFDLVVMKFDPSVSDPVFIPNWEKGFETFAKGLFIIRTDQCPYTVKNVNEICETANNIFGIEPRVITLKKHTEAQQALNPFGTFSIVYNGKIIAYHPISNKRFQNILEKVV